MGGPAKISLSLEESLPAGMRIVCFSSMLLGSMPWFNATISLADTSAKGATCHLEGTLQPHLPAGSAFKVCQLSITLHQAELLGYEHSLRNHMTAALHVHAHLSSLL